MKAGPGIPEFAVSPEHKLAIMQSFIPQLFDALGQETGNVTGDDVIDFFALGAALVIENDSYLTAPSHLRAGADSAKQHILRHIRTLREARGDGLSLLSKYLAQPPAGTAH